MSKWEYRAIRVLTRGLADGIVNTDELERLLNDESCFTWELVTAFDTSVTCGASREVIAIVKRPRK
jgi:hypothetical protein